MIVHFSEWLRRRKAAKRIRKHMALASGTHLQRGASAIAMAAVEEDVVQKVRRNLPLAEQDVFMMAYECFVMWSIMKGVESVASADETASATSAMQSYFTEHGWYVAGNFERIWEKMKQIEPKAGLKTGVVWPIADMALAVEQAGCRLTFPVDYRFGLHVFLSMENLKDVGKFTAKQYIELKSSN
jgi:hypothetical protein